MKGMTYGDLENMSASDRMWYLQKLYDQLKAEADEVKKASSGKKVRKAPKRPGRAKR